MLAGSLADVAKAAFVASHAALDALAAQHGAVPAEGPVRGSPPAPQHTQQARQQQARQQQAREHRPQQARCSPGLAFALGCSFVAHMPPAFLEMHGNDAAAAAADVAAALRRALGALQVGNVQLAVPLPVAFAVGRSLHPLQLQSVHVPPLPAKYSHVAAR